MAIAITETSTGILHPPAPASLAETGLSQDLVMQLALKTLFFAGELSGTDLATRLGLSFSVIESTLESLKAHRHCEISGGAMLGAASYRFRITDAGRTRAALFLENNHYVGVAPVPLAQYQAYLKAFAAEARGGAMRDQVRQAFSHLVLCDRVLDQLGPAVNAGHSMFVYGPPGNGKTVIAQAVHNLLEGEIAIPHALEVEGSIIRIFDPVNHRPLPTTAQANSITKQDLEDARWVRCERPMVMVGGELTLDALELSFNPATGLYRAPVQALANGGLLVIDDFGRQHCSPRDLLNRWIVPLESRVDFLTLQSGQKFELPFMALIVFATNIRPSELVDEAFLRRIQYKIFAESPTVQDFIAIFRACCRELGATADDEVVERLLRDYYRPRKIALRGCQPRDLIKQALSLASYLGQPRHLTIELLEAACDTYFVEEREETTVYA